MDWQLIASATKRRREELGLSQRRAAELAGKSPTTWGQLETHANPVEGSTLRAMARALNWPSDALERVGLGDDVDAIPTVASVPADGGATPRDALRQQLADLATRMTTDDLARLIRAADWLQARAALGEVTARVPLGAYVDADPARYARPAEAFLAPSVARVDLASVNAYEAQIVRMRAERRVQHASDRLAAIEVHRDEALAIPARADLDHAQRRLEEARARERAAVAAEEAALAAVRAERVEGARFIAENPDFEVYDELLDNEHEFEVTERSSPAVDAALAAESGGDVADAEHGDDVSDRPRPEPMTGDEGA